MSHESKSSDISEEQIQHIVEQLMSERMPHIQKDAQYRMHLTNAVRRAIQMGVLQNPNTSTDTLKLLIDTNEEQIPVHSPEY